MSGIAILVDLWRKNPSFSSKAFNSHDLLSPTLAASAAAAAAATAAAATGQSLASKFLFGEAGRSVAYADAGVELSGDYFSNLRHVPSNIFLNESVRYSTKVYPIELKPLLSAFGPKAFAMTTLRSFLLFYLPLIEPASVREDDDDFLEEAPENQRRDLVVPFKKSVKQIVYETSVVTSRRVLERLAVHYASQRMAWKLIKDIPQSARRKALRGLSSSTYLYSVTRTTFRGHFLAITASWFVQVGIEMYRFISGLTNNVEADNAPQTKVLGKKVLDITLKCSTALICASIGSGICSSLIHPTYGVIIGCTVGDIAGPILVILVCEKGFNLDLQSSG